ncbi:MAG: dTMP kinase [Bdellovibrionota bacterium]
MIIESSENYRFTNPKGFIVLEGVNGAGKTTLQNKIYDYISNKGLSCLKTREPGSSETGKLLRPIILNPPEKLSSRTELFLFAADRSQHIESVIRPALKNRELVISDRYYYSTDAFQGFGRELDRKLVSAINSIAIDGLVPDLVILLDLDPQAGIMRNRKQASSEIDSFETEQISFHTRLRNGFLQLAEELPEPFVIINAATSPDEVYAKTIPLLDSLLNSIESK